VIAYQATGLRLKRMLVAPWVATNPSQTRSPPMIPWDAVYPALAAS